MKQYAQYYTVTHLCEICCLQKLDTDLEFFSNLAYKKYMINGDGSCNTTNCIYLISCDKENCYMNYVCFTTTKT